MEQLGTRLVHWSRLLQDDEENKGSSFGAFQIMLLFGGVALSVFASYIVVQHYSTKYNITQAEFLKQTFQKPFKACMADEDTSIPLHMRRTTSPKKYFESGSYASTAASGSMYQTPSSMSSSASQLRPSTPPKTSIFSSSNVDGSDLGGYSQPRELALTHLRIVPANVPEGQQYAPVEPEAFSTTEQQQQHRRVKDRKSHKQRRNKAMSVSSKSSKRGQIVSSKGCNCEVPSHDLSSLTWIQAKKMCANIGMKGVSAAGSKEALIGKIILSQHADEYCANCQLRILTPDML